ncbi:MAG: hypothetical protein KG003_01705 [Bacteroidetes bacterium]|nr:hypothetical protein [Bacteroidota bacterium]
MNQKVLIFGLITAGALLITGCAAKKTTADECSGLTVSYEKDVQPILFNNCAKGCHSEKNKAGGIDLSTFENVKAISSESRFMGAIRHLAGFDAMPMKAPKLSDSSIRVIQCWIKNGTAQ